MSVLILNSDCQNQPVLPKLPRQLKTDIAFSMFPILDTNLWPQVSLLMNTKSLEKQVKPYSLVRGCPIGKSHCVTWGECLERKSRQQQKGPFLQQYRKLLGLSDLHHVNKTELQFFWLAYLCNSNKEKEQKSVNLQCNTDVCQANGTNDSSTKSL